MPAVEPGPPPLDEEGDAPIQISAARAALRVKDFRTVWLGALLSGVGTWMQSVTLGAYAYELTGSASFVSLTVVAHLGPALIVSPIGGVLADRYDRRRLIIGSQLGMAMASALLAVVTLNDDPNRIALLSVILANGIANSVNMPVWNAFLPTLVPREHLTGAVSLHATQMNGARVIGPAIGGFLYPTIGASGVFAINAASFVFSIGSLMAIKSPAVPWASDGPSAFSRLVEGFRIGRRDPVVRRVLLLISVFAVLSLPIIGQMPTHAAESFGMRPKSFAYGALYATFALGAVVGAVSIGTFLGGYDLRRVTRRALVAFGVFLGIFAVLPAPAPAFPIAFALGAAYLTVVTSLSTILQSNIDEYSRGRITSLWTTAFAGSVPIGGAIAGPIADAASVELVLLYGAAASVLLATYARWPASAVGQE